MYSILLLQLSSQGMPLPYHQGALCLHFVFVCLQGKFYILYQWITAITVPNAERLNM